MKEMKNSLIRIVDDEETVRESVSLFLEMAGMRVVTYASAQSFLESDNFSVPGCIILDVRMPTMSGIELQDILKQKHCDLPIVFLSGHGDIEMAVEAVHRGAVDFLVKPPKPEKLLELVEKTVIKHQQQRRQQAEKEALFRIWEQLTPSEQQVAVLLSKGLSNAEAAEVLDVTERTVKAHRAMVYSKLSVSNAVETLEFLISIGIMHGEAS